MTTRASALTALSACLLAWSGAGCATHWYDDADDDYWRNDPRPLLEAYRDAIDDPGPNALLGVEKLLSAALLQNDWQNAESLAVRASTLVNIFVAGEPGERDALSLFGQEKDKPFKGEPHERAMVDYYLGVLRFRKHDYEGALAAFRSAMNKDRGSYLVPVERRQARKGSDNAERYLYEDDYALLQFLAAKCYQLLEEPDEAKKLLDRACTTLPVMKPLFEAGMDSENNVLVLVEGGRAPAKRKTGPSGVVLGYAPGPVDVVERVALGGEELSFGVCEDLYHQATTIGGREVDKLNQVKAERQQILQAAGFATAAAGYMLAVAGSSHRGRRGDRNVEMAGLLALGVGIATIIVADVAIDPSADIRAWSTLPGQITLAVGRAKPGTRLRLSLKARGGGNDLSEEWLDVPIEDGMNLYWTRLLPGRRGGSWEPPPPAQEPAAGQGERPDHESKTN